MAAKTRGGQEREAARKAHEAGRHAGGALRDTIDSIKAAANQECDLQRRDRLDRERAQRASHAYATKKEQRHAAEELRRAVEVFDQENPGWLPNLACKVGSGQGSIEIAAFREQLVATVLQAINFNRHGHAEGSLAQHPDGRWARRYFSGVLNRLVWMVGKPPGDGPLEIEDVDEFSHEPPENEWRVVGPTPWRVIL